MKACRMVIILTTLALSVSVAADAEKVTILLTGHVRREGKYAIDKRIKQNLSDLIELAGGFDPLDEFKNETTSTVAWIERNSLDAVDQHIIIDYKNRQILSQRRIADERWRIEKYDWDTFEYLEGDALCVTTSRQSLDLAFIPIKYVEENGWRGFETLNYFGKTNEESNVIDEEKYNRMTNKSDHRTPDPL
jgi:hypothetical protein